MSTAPSPAHLFVYGTLRSDGGHPMHRVLAGAGRLLGPASVPGRLFDLGEYPGAVPLVGTERPGAPPKVDVAPRESGVDLVVRGELWALSVGEELVELDAWEGCGPDDEPPYAFRRAIAEATLDTGEAVAAWIYWYDGPDRDRPIRSGDWLGALPHTG